jgi:alpha-1,2-mannosyltransferase
MVLAGPGVTRASGAGPVSRRRGWALPVAAAACALSVAGYAADMAWHHSGVMLSWYDLNVYNHAGLIARNLPGRLYTWQLHPGIKFTYTPFAALLFAFGSLLPWAVLKWLMTMASLAALAGTVWLTLGALGWRGRARATAMLALAAVTLWMEPVQRALHLGQIELALMILIVWDLCQPDDRKWKGIGIGVAAGIKLVPLIFIPYLILAGKLRQAAVATAVFAATVVIGFVALPHESVKWWLTGYFLHAGDFSNTSLGSLLNQSVLALLERTPAGSGSVTAVWVLFAAVIGCLGLAAGALLARSGRPTAGWVTCALTGVLISPISWDNHWVWIVPLLAVLADAGVRARGAARWGYWGFGVAVAAVFADWPYHWSGRLAFVPHGLVGFYVGRHPMTEIFHLHGIQLISWNLFVLAGVAMFAFMVAFAARAWRGRRSEATA